MNYIEGTPRSQLVLFNECIDNLIAKDSPVRVIDAFVESLDLNRLGFEIPELKTGTPPYNPKLLLKIYVYGYMERTRSSRRLEKECERNKELIWLTGDLVPAFKTIADFRNKNKIGIKNVFKEFLNFCKENDLISIETVAIDGTKMRAHNSTNNVYKRDEINNVSKKIQEKIDEYLAILDEEDKKEDDNLKLGKEKVEKVLNKLGKALKHKAKVEEIKLEFEKNEEIDTIYTTDRDARFQNDKGKIRPGYNSQTVVDEKNKLIIASDVTNQQNDLNQLTPMTEKIKEIKKELNIENKTIAIEDAGYFNEAEILKNQSDDSMIYVMPSREEAERKNLEYRNKNGKEKLPAEGFESFNFVYHKESDTFICPKGEMLKRKGQKARIKGIGIEKKEYQCRKCNQCEYRSKCTTNKIGRTIEVSVNKEKIDQFKKEMKSKTNKELISKRKEIVEHPFGTMKRNWGFTYFMQKGLEKVKTEFSFICFSYNFKRVLNILTPSKMLESLTFNNNIS